MKTNLKRIGAWALCFMLLLSCIPVSADDGTVQTRDYSAGYSLDSALPTANYDIEATTKIQYNSSTLTWSVPVYYYYVDADNVSRIVDSDFTTYANVSNNGNTTIDSSESKLQSLNGSFKLIKVATGVDTTPVASSENTLTLSPSSEGNIFKNYYLKCNGTNVGQYTWYSGNEGEYAVFVEFQLNPVKATFNTDDGSEVASITDVPGTEITLPKTVPTKVGYTFLGWTVEGDETLYRPEDTYELSTNTTFTAQWAENVELTYYRDDTLIHSQTSYVGAQIQLYYPEFNDLDERTVFDGWMDSNGDLVDPAGEELYTVTGAMRFTAHFTQGILVNLNPGTEGTFGDGVSNDVLIFPIGDTYGTYGTYGTWEDSFPLPDSTVEGKVFSHWVDDEGNVVTNDYEFTKDATFTAVFVEQPLEIVGDSHYVLVGNQLQLRVIGTSEPVTWSSQNTDILTVDQNGLVTGVASGSTRVVAELEDGTTAEYIVTVMEGEFTIEYVIDYPDDAVKYVLNGTTPSFQAATDTIVEDQVPAIPGTLYNLRNNDYLDCVNYVVTGWLGEDGEEYDFSDEITVDGNMKFTAIFAANGKEQTTLTVKYVNNYSTKTYSDYPVIKVDIDGVSYYQIRAFTAQQFANAFNTTAFNLEGYSLTNNGAKVVDQGKIYQVAVSSVSNNTITFYPVNGSENVALFFVLKPSLTEHPSGNDFSNWYVVGTTKLKDGATEKTHSTKDVTDTTVDNMIDEIAEDVPTIDEVLALMTGFDTANSAYAVRWYNYVKESEAYHIDGILYRKGVYHSIQYIDTYNGQVVELYNSIGDGEIRNLSKLAPSSSTLSGTKAGLVFDGWYFDQEGTVPIDTNNIYVYRDYKIYAIYKQAFTVQFLGEEGEDLRVDGSPADYYQVVTQGSNAAYPASEPTKDGYSFDGWYTEMGGQGTKVVAGSSLLTNIQANAVYYAHFTRDTGTLTVSKVVQNEKGESIAALAGETFTFRIDGFDPGSTVHYTVSDDSTQRSATADSTLGEIELSIGANQTITFTDAQTGNYTVTERDVKKGTLTANGKTYTVASSTDSGTLDKERECTLSITNKRLEDFSITVRKVWDDASNQDGKRAAVTINLMRSSNNGEPELYNSYAFEVDGTTNIQEHTFTNVARYDADGNPYTYSVKEQGESNGTITLNGAEYSVEYSEVDGALVVTNSYTPETVDVNVTKTWDDFDNATGYRPNSDGITLTLSASYTEDGQSTPIAWSKLATSASESQTIDEGSLVTDKPNQWKATWSGLPKYYNGHLITYTVSEDAVPHYSVTSNSVLSTTASSYDLSITNTIDLIDVTITKNVTGNMGDANKSFNFEVSLYGSDGTASISGASLSDKTTGDGKPTVTINGTTASFTLKHGQSVTLGGIPYGAQLGIKESGKTGYVATIGGVAGNDSKASDSYTEKVTIVPSEGKAQPITVTNDNTATIDTGVTLDFLPYVLLILGVGVVVALWLVMSAKKRKDD